MVEWYSAVTSSDKPSRRKLALAAAGGVVVVALTGAVVSNATSGAGEVVVDSGAIEATIAPTATLIVHVVGAVVSPGVYEVPSGARVLDAVKLAGGLSDDADPASLNLARTLDDGEQILVGEIGQSNRGSSSATSTRINVNTATTADFEALPRIGPTLAERIVSFRDENGPFASLDGLLDVPGIGQLTLDGMRDHLTL